MMCFHYRRRREPPVSLRTAYFHLAFLEFGHLLVFILGGILVLPNICNGKIRGWAIHVQINTLLNIHKKSLCFVSTMATTGTASVAQNRLFPFGFYRVWPFVSLHFSLAEHLQRQNKGFGDPCVDQYTFEFAKEQLMS